jgi:hypothetical protein
VLLLIVKLEVGQHVYHIPYMYRVVFDFPASSICAITMNGGINICGILFLKIKPILYTIYTIYYILLY